MTTIGDMMETIQIKVTVEGGFQHDHVFYSKEDISTEPLELGLYFIKAGWAEDTSGVVPSCTPDKSEVILAPEHLMSHAVSSTVGV